MTRWPPLALLVLLCLTTLEARADVRAWLDRERIAAGETATLNIESDRADVDAPDYGPLSQDFRLSGHSSRRSVELVNGRRNARILFAVALQPRREGVIGIPAIAVGGERTQPLALTVTPAATAPARAGEVAFIETEIDDANPYVQQSVGMAVRLYYAVPLISGQLDQAQPEGASLRQVGQDLQYSRELAGRRYTVVERRYQLIPERSGALTVPGASFRGRGVGGFFDDLFGGNGRALAASAVSRTLQVRPPPASAPQPWLPLHELRLRYVATPQSARAGEAATVILEATADGASAAQLPELQLLAGDGAQVFAEPAQADESFEGGRAQVVVTQRFSVVPVQAGTLRIEGPSLPWWDVNADASRSARLPPLSVRVAPGQGPFAAPAAPPPAAAGRRNVGGASGVGDWIKLPGVQGEVGVWALGTVAFALLWLLTLAWGLNRRAESRDEAATTQVPVVSQRPLAALKRALDIGDLGDVADALCATASPPAADLDALRARIGDSEQRDAIDALQHARWGGGDAVVARRMLRSAFARGPRWRDAAPADSEPLLPLYPR